jgi:hypothetical protein
LARSAAVVGVLSSLFFVPLSPVLAETPTGVTAHSLLHLRGYYPASLLLDATPSDEQVDTASLFGADTLMAAIGTRLKNAGLLMASASDVGDLRAHVLVLPERQGLRGWFACLQVREPVRPVRAPQLGLISAVTWYRCDSGLTEKESLEATVAAALSDLTDRLINAHGRGGEPLP